MKKLIPTPLLIWCLLLSACKPQPRMRYTPLPTSPPAVSGSTMREELDKRFNGTTDISPKLIGTHTDGTDSITKYNVSGVVDITAYGAVAGGIGGTDNTTAIQTAIAAVPLGGSLWIPPASSCYRFTTLSLTHSIRIAGGGWSNDDWGSAFGTGSVTKWHGSVLCSSQNKGRAIDASTDVEENLGLDNIAIVGSGSTSGNVTSGTISAISESGTTVTATATNTFSAGDPIFISGVGVADYDGFFEVASASGSQFTYVAQVSGLSSSSGGTATQTSVGVIIGDRYGNHLATGAHAYNVSVGNFGVNFYTYSQNSRFYHVKTGACGYEGFYLSGNANLFSGPFASGGCWRNVDANSGQTLLMTDAVMENPKQSDATATQATITDCDTCTLDGTGYWENSTNGFTGRGIYLRQGPGNATSQNTWIGQHFSCGTGGLEQIHVGTGVGGLTMIDLRAADHGTGSKTGIIDGTNTYGIIGIGLGGDFGLGATGCSGTTCWTNNATTSRLNDVYGNQSITGSMPAL